MRQLVTRLQAQLDAEETASWYESRRVGLGLRFLDELDYVLKRVTAAPLQFPVIHAGVRRHPDIDLALCPAALRIPSSRWYSGIGARITAIIPASVCAQRPASC
jgi:hypothetical protein